MESQEALKRIRREAGTPYFSTLYDIDMWREDFKTIEEDLEVLEILKKYLMVDTIQAYYGESVIYMKDIIYEKEEFKKVKEWLEREENNEK